ncbi:MAG: bile acid:sodium symporter family protein [Anditalea sp.]
MNNKTIYQILLGIATICLFVAIIRGLNGNLEQAGPFFIGFFVALALGFRGYEHLKGFTYATMIFAAVTTALYYPVYFLEIDGFQLSSLITPLIQIIMFGMGTSMALSDFIGVAKMPKGVLLGILCQFTIMPILGFFLAYLSNFPPEIAAGIILIGCSPSGLASNVMSYLAKANLALSITITAITTLLAPFITPLLMKMLAGAFIEINVLNMMWDIFKMVIIPIGAGLLFNRLFRGKPIPFPWFFGLFGVLFNKLFSGKSKWLDEVMPMVSMIGIGVIIVIITAAGRDSLLDIGGLLILLVLIHNLFGYNLGYWVARLFKMDERDCRTIALEVGMQNGGLASGLAKEMGKIATVGLAPAVFGPLMNITGSILASYWHKKPPKNERDENKAIKPNLDKPEEKNKYQKTKEK